MDEEDIKANIVVQDYAQVLFNLSRWKEHNGNGNTVEIERAWVGDVAVYIAELENKIRSLATAST
jgi:hypothetical protein